MVVAQLIPDAADKINADQLADVKADRLGVDPRIVVSTEDAQRLREARNAAIAAQEQQLAMQQSAETAKTLSETPLGQDSALDAVGANGAP